MRPNYPLSMRVCELGLLLLIMATAGGTARADDGSSIRTLNTVTTVSTTIPPNGDVNPYGVAQVHRSMGRLIEGRLLISNFNNGGNKQGTGTTIVEIARPRF